MPLSRLVTFSYVFAAVWTILKKTSQVGTGKAVVVVEQGLCVPQNFPASASHLTLGPDASGGPAVASQECFNHPWVLGPPFPPPFLPLPLPLNLEAPPPP